MKLSQSDQFVPRKKSSKKLKRHESSMIQEGQPITISIKISKNDELEPAFVDTFSKFIINNTNFNFYDYYGDIKTTTYSQFYETLRNLRNQIKRATTNAIYQEERSAFKKARSYENVRKSSVDVIPLSESKKYVFSFEAQNNSIILLIDASPYMLLYDYGTSSFLLQNTQEIVTDLFVQLERHYDQRKNGSSGPSYFISCYIFSVYNQNIEQVLKQQQIFFGDAHENKFRNSTLISDYICAYLNRSSLLHEPIKNKVPIPISKMIQQVLNLQGAHSGIKILVTISAFKELDSCPYIFFSSNWYTFCFICAGELNFGSFIIDSSEIVNKFSKGAYLETRFVYKCKFLQNWEKVHLIEWEGFEFKYLDSTVRKGRAILYISSKGEKKETIFQDILKFNLKLNEKRKRDDTSIRSNENMTGSKQQKQINQYEFDIPVQNISQIMRAKYLQGWQQIPTDNYPPNTKYIFRLEYANKTGIYYNATRISESFNVKVSSIFADSESKVDQKVKLQRRELIDRIKKIDMINTSNFDMIVTAFKKKNNQEGSSSKLKSKQQKFYVNLENNGHENIEMVNEILKDHEEWNCYFKVRTIYVHFTPNTNYINDFNQLLNEVGFFLGERISNLCFMQRKEKKEKVIDHLKEKEVSRWNIIFVKVSGILHFLEFKFGFLKYTDNEIRQTLDNIENKLVSKKLANGSIKIVPEDIYSYCLQKFDEFNKLMRRGLSSVFEKSWRITFKNSIVRKVFLYMNSKILKKLQYNLLRSKQGNSYYFNIINLTERENSKNKGIFLQVKQLENNSIEFKLETFSSFSHIDISKQQLFSQMSLSDKNIYQMTQRSISSSGREFSIGSSSLPLIANNSMKESISKTFHQNQAKYKNSFLELFDFLVQELKQSQKRLVNLLKCYTEIYDQLIKKRLEQKKSGVEDEQLIQKIKELYHFSGDNFETDFLFVLVQTKKQHYNEQYPEISKSSSTNSNRRTAKQAANQNPAPNIINQINIDEIPEPNDYLMESPISTIKGDLTLISKSNFDKKYVFFLVTPNRVAYVCKKPASQKIYYRCLSNIYSPTSIEKQEAKLKVFFEKELIGKINRQLKEEQYLSFYNVVAKEGDQFNNNPSSMLKIQGPDTWIKMLYKKQSVINSFVGVSVPCKEIFQIIHKQENRILQPRMIKVLAQFQQKFYEAISLFFEQSSLPIYKSELVSSTAILREVLRVASDKQIKYQGTRSDEKNNNNSQKDDITSEQEQVQIVASKMNHYFFQKKNPFSDQKQTVKFSIVTTQQLNEFNNIVLKICTNNQAPVNQENFISLFINKNRKNSSGYYDKLKQSIQSTKHIKSEINLNFFGFRATKQSAKIQWLNEIISQLVTECVTYLNIVTITQSNQIKEVQNKFTDYIVKGPSQKISDDIWNQSEIVRQIQSGHMRSIIPFYQYSNRQFPAKFIARQIQNVPASYTPLNKPNHIFYLKYWLTLEITPARVIKTKLIPFKHISLATEIILSKSKDDYQVQMSKMIENYITELIKFLKMRNIFKAVQHKLLFPLDPPIPLFINMNIYTKLEQEKKKSMKIKMPKKFKNRPTNYPNLDMKSISTIGTDQSFITTTLDSSMPLYPRISVGSEEIPNLKQHFRLPLIYQNSIAYFPKFEQEQFFSLLACCEKLNPYAIRNLDNTYIFFNPELKEYFIFYLEQSPIIPSSSSFSFDQAPRYDLMDFKRKSNMLTYSVYCVDKTVQKQAIEKLHGSLIKKALEEVTFGKIAMSLYHNHNLIDEPEEEYFARGSTEQIVFKLPSIMKKSNFNSYMKQHLQKMFHHKKTELKSDIKKRQIDKNNEIVIEEQIQAKSFKDMNKISTKKNSKKQVPKQSKNDHIGCVPDTYIFNTIKDRSLEQTFGKCIFLARLSINEDNDTVENAMFWSRYVKPESAKRSLSKVYIYPFMSNCGSSQEYNQRLLLEYLQSYSNVKQTKERRMRKSSLCSVNIPKAISSSILGSDNQVKNTKEVDIHKQLDSGFRQSNESFTTIRFKIIASLGFPKFKFIQQMYEEVIYFALYDYYLENRLFRQLFANFNLCSTSSVKRQRLLSCDRQNSMQNDYNRIDRIKKELKESDHTDSKTKPYLSLIKAQSSPDKQIVNNTCNPLKSFMLLYSDEFVNSIYQSLLFLLYDLEQKIPIKKNSCVFNYKSENKILIQQKIPPLISFIKLVADNFSRFAQNGEKYALRLIIYGVHRKSCQIQFWGSEFERKQKQRKQQKCKYADLFERIASDIQINQYQFSKMGIFFCDSLQDIDSLRKSFFLKDREECSDTSALYRIWQSFNRTEKFQIEFDWMKKFTQGKSFCLHEFLFRRSLLMHYEVSDSQFLCYTYNFKKKQISNILEHLEEMEHWFAEKYRLYLFISKLKKAEQQTTVEYEIPVAPEVNSIKKLFDHEQKNLHRQSMLQPYRPNQPQSNEVEINLTKLLKMLAFEALPFKNFMKSKMSIEKMYKILATNVVPYSNYPEYKDKQKSKLARLAREYISIIRHYFGVQRNPRKQSMIPVQLKQPS